MARDTAAIGTDVVIGENTPPVETTVEALIRQYNRQPLNSSLSTGDLVYWDATAGAWVRVAGTKSAGQLPVAQADGTVAWGNGSSLGVFIGADELDIWLGAPTLSDVRSRPAWLLANSEGVGNLLLPGRDFPTAWASVNAWVWLSQNGIATGNVNVTLRDNNIQAGAGDTMASPGGDSSGAPHNNVASAAPGQYVIERRQIWAGLTVDGTKSLLVAPFRSASGDTFGANDIALLGVEVDEA